MEELEREDIRRRMATLMVAGRTYLKSWIPSAYPRHSNSVSLEDLYVRP